MIRLRTIAIFALAIVMALSTVTVAFASTSEQAQETEGIFGTFVRKEGSLLTVMTKEGAVTVQVATDSEFKAPGMQEGATLDVLTTEDKLAIQIVSRDGTRVAVRVMRMPRQPTHVHKVEVVVSAEGSTLTLTDKDGNTRTVEIPQEKAQNIVGQVITSINRELRAQDNEIKREAKELVRADSIKEKLENNLEKVGGQQAKDDAEVQQKGREVERRVAQLQRLQQQSITILQGLTERAPEEAKEALNHALELAEQSREITAEVIQRVDNASKVELGKVKGVIEAINLDADTIDVAFDNDTVVTVRLADDAKILRDDKVVYLEDLRVGDVIVRAAYNPETFTAHALVIRTPEKPNGDTSDNLRETLKGYIGGIDLAAKTIVVYSPESTADSGKTITLTDSTEIEKNGALVSLDQLAVKDFVLVVLDPQTGGALRLVVRSPESVEKPQETERHRKVVKGHIVEISVENRTVTIAETSDEGRQLTVKITEATRIVRNGKDGSLLREFAAGDTLLHLVYDVETEEAIMIVVDARKANRPIVETQALQGVIKSVNPDTGVITLVTNRGAVDVVISSDTKITKNGAIVGLADLEARNIVEVKLDAETGTALSLEVKATISIKPIQSSIRDTTTAEASGIKGIIRGLDVDSRTLAIATREGAIKFHVAEDATITMNGETVKLESLVVGSIVEAKLAPDRESIMALEVTSPQANQQVKPEERDKPETIELKGVIKGIELDSNTLVISTPEGLGKFTVTRETELHKNGKDATLKDLQQGDETWVKVRREDRTILEMEAYSTRPTTALDAVSTGGTAATSAGSSNKDTTAAAIVVVKGTIREVDVQSNTIVLTIEKVTAKLHVTSETAIFKDGQKASFGDLKAGDQVWAAVQVEGRTILKMEVRSPEKPTSNNTTSSTTTSRASTDTKVSTEKAQPDVKANDSSTDGTREPALSDASSTGSNDNVVATTTKVHGTIQTIYLDTGTLVLVTDGETLKLRITRETTIHRDGKESAFSSLQPRDLVWATFNKEQQTILEVEAESPEPTPTPKASDTNSITDPSTTTRIGDSVTSSTAKPTPTPEVSKTLTGGR